MILKKIINNQTFYDLSFAWLNFIKSVLITLGICFEIELVNLI